MFENFSQGSHRECILRTCKHISRWKAMIGWKICLVF